MRSLVFRDFDAFAESVHGVEIEMTIRNPTHRRWSISAVDVDGIEVQMGRLGSGNIAQGRLRPDGCMLYLPLTKTVEYSANGTALEENAFIVLEPGCEFCISTQVAHDWCVAFVPTRLLTQGDEGMEPQFLFERKACRVTRPNRQAAAGFRGIADQVITTAADCLSFESSLAATRAATELREVISLAIGPQRADGPNREGRPRVPRQRIIRRALSLLERNAGVPVTVGELAQAADVSERTVRTAFHEYFGVGPVRYLQLRQLHLVHRALRVADPQEVTVSRVLVDHGEWSFSRFASRYRQLFGELPSETLRRKPR